MKQKKLFSRLKVEIRLVFSVLTLLRLDRDNKYFVYKFRLQSVSLPLIDISNFYNEMLFRNIARQEKSCKPSKSFSNRLINDVDVGYRVATIFFSRRLDTSLKKKKIEPQNYLCEYSRVRSLRVGLPPSKSLETSIWYRRKHFHVHFIRTVSYSRNVVNNVPQNLIKTVFLLFGILFYLRFASKGYIKTGWVVLVDSPACTAAVMADMEKLHGLYALTIYKVITAFTKHANSHDAYDAFI